MQISKETMRLYAAKHYDNPFCLTESEFNADVFKSSVIKRMLTAYMDDRPVNIQSIVNTTIGFYNVFNHHAATMMLQFKLYESQYALMNSILLYLRYPLILDGSFDNEFLLTIQEIYK